MFALIENATGRVLSWQPTPPTAAAGQTVVPARPDFNLVDTSRWRYVFAVAQGVVSITQVGGLATATTQNPHNFVNGQNVTIAGADQPEYNQTRSVTVTGATTFTFPVSDAAVSPATGVISVTPTEGFRAATQAEIDADIVLRKDAEADAIFATAGDGVLTPAIFKKALAAVMKVTHDNLTAIETAAGLPATTVPGFAAFVQAVKTDFRNRL